MISIIIPTLNEEKTITSTLRDLKTQKGEFEIIVVDGGSKDNTIKLIKKEKDVKLFTSKKGRANQMNAGAKKAKGDTLLFLHADTKLPRGALKEITTILKDPEISAGGFTKTFNHDHWMFRYIFLTTTIWFRLFKDIYGDQAMFTKRSTFKRSGSFPNIALMEDVEISKRLRKLGKLTLSKKQVITSTRRFTQGGVIRTFLFMMLIYSLYHLGLSAKTIEGWYGNAR